MSSQSISQEDRRRIFKFLDDYSCVRIKGHSSNKQTQNVRDRRLCPHCIILRRYSTCEFRLKKGESQFKAGCQHGLCNLCGKYFCFNCLKTDCPNSWEPCKNSEADTQRI